MIHKTIDDLLLPGTPEEVRERYRSLEKRAHEMSFDLLEQDIVFLDTETTGLSFRDCELIQISAAIADGRMAVDRFDTFVHPGGPIPPEITRLTGIRDLDVMDAPRPREAVAALADFVGGQPVVAHNVSFDRTFIESVPGGRAVSDIWIDSLALSRIALPRLSTHRLADMAEAFGCASVTHRANDDVDALLGIWRILLVALSDLPDGLLEHLAGLHEDTSWSFRPIFRQLAALKGPQRFSLHAARRALVSKHPAQPRTDAAERASELVAPPAEEIAAAFGRDGMLASMYRSYEDRPEQVRMACAVRDAQATSAHAVIEAGTGVGKSLAYLLPSVLFAQANQLSVGIATKTNALTDQLVSQELPALARVLPEGLTFASLKGYDHYPCLERLERACLEDLPVDLVESRDRSETAIQQEMLTAMAVTYAYSCQSVDGDLDALGIRWRAVPRRLLTTTSSECQRHRCPFYPDECLVHGARKRAAAADIVVTNHALLLRNVVAEGKILPPIRHWVVDEAHGFEEEARHQWALELSAAALREGFEVLGGTRSGTLHRMMQATATLDGASLIQRLVTKCSASASRAQVACQSLFDAIQGLASLARGGAYDAATIWIDDKVRTSSVWRTLDEAGADALERLTEVEKDAQALRDALAGEDGRLAGTMGEAMRFLSEAREVLSLVLAGEDKSYVYYAEVMRRRHGPNQLRLVAEKVDVGADLAERWLPEMMSVVFSSATMAVGGSFEHFEQSVGLDRLPRDKVSEYLLPSSFDFDHNMAVVVCRDLPAPGTPRYLDALANLLFDVHVSMGGSVLTLFTNRREMETVFSQLEGRLAAEGIELACQSRGASPRRLRQRFLADKDLSLFALKSFWEGFDAAGETLRCVVIAKLPFANPNDPLVKEREARDPRSWWHNSLPEAVVSVKQAAGRLIRTKTDTGVLVLADSRLATKRYGQQFLRSLPSQTVVHLDAANIRRFFGMWKRSR